MGQKTVAGAALRPLWAKHPTRGWICCQTDHKKQLLLGSCLSLSGNKFMERVNTVTIIHSLQYCLDTQLRADLCTYFDLVYNLPDGVKYNITVQKHALKSVLILLVFSPITSLLHSQCFNISSKTICLLHYTLKQTAQVILLLHTTQTGRS